MTQATPFDTGHLRRRARLAAAACRLTALAVPALLLVSWVLGEASATALSRLGLAPDHTVSAYQFAAAIILSLSPALALARSLFAVAACFDGFARGEWFGPRQPAALATAGRWLIGSGLLTLTVPSLLGLVLTLDAAPGMRVLAISVSSTGILAILFGTLLWVLGHLWTVARRIASENAQFV
jgi:hypothetical protein